MKTQQIFSASAPYDNPYQGKDYRMLFVCSAGLLRSPTGAAVGVKRGYNTRSCGSFTSLALIPLSANLIEWAKTIVFVNKQNYDDALFTFEGTGYEVNIAKKAVILEIQDSFNYNDKQLVGMFNNFFDTFERK